MTFDYNDQGIRSALAEAEGGQRGSWIALFADGTTSGFHTHSTRIEDENMIAIIPAWSNEDIEDHGTVPEGIDWIMSQHVSGEDPGFWQIAATHISGK